MGNCLPKIHINGAVNAGPQILFYPRVLTFKLHSQGPQLKNVNHGHCSLGTSSYCLMRQEKKQPHPPPAGKLEHTDLTLLPQTPSLCDLGQVTCPL